MPDNIIVDVDIENVTENDAGKYRVVRQWKSEDLDESIHLKTIDERMIPKIARIQHTILDPTVVLECRSSSSFTGELFWSVNGSLIINQGRYSQNDTFLSIKNLTIDDKYNVYKCNQSGTELESDPYSIQIYGPDVILFNSSDKIISLHEEDSITISCFAKCFPSCGIRWTETKSEMLIRGAELELNNLKRNHNYTCHATNARHDNATITDTIYVIVKSGINDYKNTAMTTEGDSDEFPSKLHLLNILLGTGIIIAAALLACLRQKIRSCLHVEQVSDINTFADSKNDDRGEKLLEEIPSGNYWTIVSNAEGELSSAIETDFERRRNQQLIVQNIVSTNRESKERTRPREVRVIVEVEGYLNPTEAYPVELDDYIHPVNTDPLNSGVIPTGQSTVRPSESHVNLELDGYLNPIEACPVKLDYIHPVKTDPLNSEVIQIGQSREF